MSNQPHRSRPTWRASYRQLHPEEFRAPGIDIEGSFNTNSTPPPPSISPIAEQQDPTTASTKRPGPNIFKAGPFSQLPIQGGVRPVRPLGYKPKPLYELEISDLYPDDELNNETAALFHGGVPRDPATATATRRSSQRKEPRLPPLPPPSTILSLPDFFLDSSLSQEFFEEHSRFLNAFLYADPPSATLPNSNSNPPSLNSSYHSLPLPAALNQHHHHQPILPLYTSPSASEISLLRPQSFLSFLYEYTTTFFNYVFDINVSSKSLYGMRSRTNRNTCYYGESGGGGEGQVNQVLRDRERRVGST